VIVGAVVTSISVAGGWHSAHADGAPNFGSYTLTATAPGFEMWEDEPSANAHPEGGGQAPYSTSALTSGGRGYGLSSVAWPGATEANADKIALLLFPKSVNGVAVPDAVTGLVGQAAPAANYPIRAEARTGGGKPDSTFDAQGATLKAHADALLATGTAAMKGAEGQAGFSFGDAQTIATSVLSGTTGQASADSRISKIDIGGVIKIQSVTSTATSASDGRTGTSSGSTVVQGLTIGGQPAFVDEQGVHIGEQGQPANAVVSQIANQALTKGGFAFYVAQPQQEITGANAGYTAGSLIIDWKPPSNPSGNEFFIALGGARVSVAATPGIASAPPVTTPAPPSTAPVTASSGGHGGITSTPVTSATPAPAVTRPSSSNPLASNPIAATFDGLGGWVVAGLLGAGLMAAGTRKVADDIVARAPSTCPLETI
jgi:hypothetical protein